MIFLAFFTPLCKTLVGSRIQRLVGQLFALLSFLVMYKTLLQEYTTRHSTR